MNVEFTEEQKILRESVARFCKTEIPLETVRKLTDQGAGLGSEIWNKIAAQAWLGVLIPEEYGGLGLGVTELGIILEEMGRALVPGNYFSTAALAAPALALGGSVAQKSRWLEELASGQTRGTLALLEEDAVLGPLHARAAAEKNGRGFVLKGKKFFVPDLASSELVIVALRTGAGEDGTTLFLLETAAEGISIEENKLTDSTSRSAQLVLKNVQVGPESIIGVPGEGWRIVDSVLLIANAGLAGSSVAGAEEVLKQAVAYARQRIQFGVPIGSFQAVKHPLANLFAEIESARSAYHFAAWAVDTRSQDVKRAVALARLACTEAYNHAALTSLQIHGGIGFTWEYDLHLHLKRAKHNQCFLGVASDYEEIIARQALGI